MKVCRCAIGWIRPADEKKLISQLTDPDNDNEEIMSERCEWQDGIKINFRPEHAKELKPVRQISIPSKTLTHCEYTLCATCV